MIRWRLSEVMKEKKVDTSALVKMTGIYRQTVRSLLAEDQSRFDGKTLNKLCKALDVAPGDLIQYVED